MASVKSIQRGKKGGSGPAEPFGKASIMRPQGLGKPPSTVSLGAAEGGDSLAKLTKAPGTDDTFTGNVISMTSKTSKPGC
jgi:hypothetical protein